MKNKRIKKRERDGVTLMTLVLTIVLLLVLSGVSISLVFGQNGIIERARSTGKIQTVASLKEALELEKGDLLVDSKTVNLNNYLDQITTGNKKYDISSKEIIDDKNAEIVVNDKYKFVLKDNEKGDVEITYQGVSDKKDLTISPTSGTYTYPESGTFIVTNNTSGGKLVVSSNAPNIATASIEGNVVTVIPGTIAGKANIIVKSLANGEYAENKVVHEATVENGTISLKATPYTGVYDGKVHDAITKIDVNPSDAKIEYSTDGINYSEKVPSITDTSTFTVTVRASKEGYKTQTTTETVKVIKAEGSLTLSATSGAITYPNSTTFTVSNNTGNLSVSSSNSNIASASISGNTVTVKSGTTAGTATITVTSAEAANYNTKSATYTATVNNGTISLRATPYSGTYDGKAHNALTNVTVNPSDAKLEYSTNGTTYSTTMPTITNTSSFTVTVKASKAGYKTQTTTQTTKVNKANGNLTLSATSGKIAYPITTSTTFTVSNNTGRLSVSSSNANVATAGVSGNTVTVKFGSIEGTATITVTSAATTNYNAKTATYTVTVKKYAEQNKKITYSDGEVWIPEGFRVSDDSASTVQGGVVIEDKDDNQFVWIPVASISDYKRTAYSTNVETNKKDSSTNSTKINITSSNSNYFTEALPSDEQTSVNTYKGYYIGRYEAGDKESTAAKTLRSSNDVSKTVTIKANQAPYNYVTRTQAKLLAENFGTQQGYKAKTKLVSSYAWDTAIAFIQKSVSNYGNSSPQGNYRDTTFTYTDITGAKQTKLNGDEVLIPTGQTTPVCNIYDMGGNVYEWTTESCSGTSYPFTFRGGSFSINYAFSPAGYRSGVSDSANGNLGCRLTLFL